ncbi:cryptochrome-1 isoform X2 [Alligator mississippiensis]|uniref:cryptochrome-1 isoform X2 n=1 Tax=Alligator mississippiensis TaxID=8496 RepID=UPI0009070EB2|nr:cryptochrome-1 isoform X2 [Alligator mississippiensis]
MKHSCIHWFRKGLRLHDNPALLAAMKDCSELYPIFILDPWFPKNMQVSVNRWRFLVESLKDLDESLKKLNSRLFVVRGHPAEVFPGLFKAWKVTRLTFEVDTEPYSKQRDAEVVRLAAAHGVQVIQKVSHTLYDTDRVIAENNGKVPLTYRQLQAVLAGLGPPKQPVLAPTLETLKDCCTPGRDNRDPKYEIPTLEELGQDPKEAGPCLYPGGESEALSRLAFHMKRMKKHSSPPVSLHGQLLWREFFYTAGAGIPNFNRMEGNPICVQVDWDDNPEYVKAWKEGRTGYPFIDAIMTQLRTEGWIHHLARHAVACFLTRGDLWVSWEEGQKVFEELLLDADWSLNAGNWQWLSASAFFHQFFRVYSPVAFGKKTDKSGAYIKKYLPILRKFPAEYIYEPWKAPRSMQEQAGCIIGRDYPKPIVEHEALSKRNIMRMKAAYAQRSHSKAAQVEKESTKKGGKRKLPAGPSVVELLTKKPKAKSS